MKEISIPAKARRMLSKDPVLAPLLKSLVPTFQPSRGGVYQDLVEAVVYQQISIKAAKTIFEKFCHFFGGHVPGPELLSAVTLEELSGLGLSGQKANYILNIAEYFHSNALTDADFEPLSDQEVIEKLTQIKGVGAWTGQMILIFSLGRPDVFPIKDYGIQCAMIELYHLSPTINKALLADCIEIADAWKPYRTYGTLLLWAWKRKQMNM